MKQKQALVDWPWMSAIVAIHFAAIGAALYASGANQSIVIPPRITGVLISETPSTSLDAPRPPMLEPRKTQPKKETPVTPIRNAPPSERAVTAPPQQTPANTAPASQSGSSQVSLPRSDAAHLNNPKPSYPAVSRRMGEQGRVLLSVYILPDGSVGEIKLKQSSGHPRLDQSALDAVKRWRYIPARRGNEPIPYWYVQPINFTLDS